jgi:hypothetical protein
MFEAGKIISADKKGKRARGAVVCRFEFSCSRGAQSPRIRADRAARLQQKQSKLATTVQDCKFTRF